MSRDKREPDYPAELETHFILRLPEEPAKQLRDVLKTGENLKNRLTIKIDNDMRRGEVRFDNWPMHGKIVDLPTITESLKTIDNKSFYKCADISQMMICKLEGDQFPVEEETRKKKDPNKVEKKFLWPHGITPPTKNVRKRRFRKTLRKKCAEAPEIEKEVKRLLRADNEAASVTWEVITEEDEQLQFNSEPSSTATTVTNKRPEKKSKAERGKSKKTLGIANEPSNVVDIFGGAVSDSEEENNADIEDGRLSAYDSRLSDTNSMQGISDAQNKGNAFPTQFESGMFNTQKSSVNQSYAPRTVTSHQMNAEMSSEIDDDYAPREMPEENMDLRAEQLRTEIEELKQRKQRTQHEISGIENLALRKRFEDILHTLNQEIMYKEMEYQGILVLQNSEVI